MATYWVKSGTGGTDAGTSWANAAESIAGLMAAQAIAGGDIIYVHNTHSVTAATTNTWTLPESGTGIVRVLCVDGGDATGASLVDGTVGSLTTGATELSNTNAAFTVNTVAKNSALFIHGMTLKAGQGGNEGAADFNIATAGAGTVVFSACNLELNSTSTSAYFQIGASYPTVFFDNCSFTFGNASQGFWVWACDIYEKNCALAGTAITTLFKTSGDRKSLVKISGSDLSNATNLFDAAMSCNHTFEFNNCVIGTPTTGTHVGYGGMQIECQACSAVDGTNGADILSYYYEESAGVVEDDQTVYLTTGGAQGTQDDGTATSYSLKMTPSARATVLTPLYTPWIYKKVAATGDKTITMKAADTESSALTTSEIFMEVEYMGEPGATGTQRIANSPMSIIEVDDNCNIATGTIYRDVTAAGSARTDTAEAWTGVTETSTYTFTASVNLAEQGYIRCRIGLAKDTTNPVYVDPSIGVA